jgi:hypothetical protein
MWYDIFGFSKRRPVATRKRVSKRKVANVVVVSTRNSIPMINTSTGKVSQMPRRGGRR